MQASTVALQSLSFEFKHDENLNTVQLKLRHRTSRRADIILRKSKSHDFSIDLSVYYQD